MDPQRESELLVVQDVVVYVSSEMFSWHPLCCLSLDPETTVYLARWIIGQLVGDD